MADSAIPPEDCPPWEEKHVSDWKRIYEPPMQMKVPITKVLRRKAK